MSRRTEIAGPPAVLGRTHVLDSVEVAQRREQAGPREGDRERADPPITTDRTTPNAFAATPDANAPSSFDALMKTRLTALTRPRIAFGVRAG